MNRFFASLKPAAIILGLLTILLGLIYPLFMFGVGQLFFHKSANGSLVHDQSGKVIGSERIGQNFERPEYFHPRPSKAGEKGYDAAHSSGSNLGPTSQKLIDSLTKRANEYRLKNKLAPDTKIPADAVTASGSGLDPHISVQNALLQAARVAETRGLTPSQIQHLIEEYTESPEFWLFGHPRINVLRLNRALDLDPFHLKGTHENRMKSSQISNKSS